jgi:hypothetical protein
VSSEEDRISEEFLYNSARRALSQCADRHRKRTLLSSVNLKKNPLKDLLRVVEHPADSAIRLLE